MSGWDDLDEALDAAAADLVARPADLPVTPPMSRNLVVGNRAARPSEDPIWEFSESMAMLGRWGRP